MVSTNHDVFIQSPFIDGRGFFSFPRSLTLDFPIARIFLSSCCKLQLKISLPFFPLASLFFLSFFFSARAAAACSSSSGQGEGRPTAEKEEGKGIAGREETCSGGSGRAPIYSTAIVQKGGGADGGASFVLSFFLFAKNLFLLPYSDPGGECRGRRRGAAAREIFFPSETEWQSTNRERVEREERELFSFFFLQRQSGKVQTQEGPKDFFLQVSGSHLVRTQIDVHD